MSNREEDGKELGAEHFWKTFEYRRDVLIYLDIDSDEAFLLNLLSTYNPCYPSLNEIERKARWRREKTSKKMLSLRHKKYISAYSPLTYLTITGKDLRKEVRDDQLIYVIEYEFIKNTFLFNELSNSKIKPDNANCNPVRKSNRFENRTRSGSKIELDPVRKSNCKVLKKSIKETTTTTTIQAPASENLSSSSYFLNKSEEEGREIPSFLWEQVEIPDPLVTLEFGRDILDQLQNIKPPITPHHAQKCLYSFAYAIAIENIGIDKTPKACFMGSMRKGGYINNCTTKEDLTIAMAEKCQADINKRIEREKELNPFPVPLTFKGPIQTKRLMF